MADKKETNTVQIRVVKFKGATYLRREDVVQLLLDTAGQFPTDERRYVEELASVISSTQT
jgi:hypothetical protein